MQCELLGLDVLLVTTVLDQGLGQTGPRPALCCHELGATPQTRVYDLRLFDTGDHFDGTATLLTGFDLEQVSSSKADGEAFAP